MLTKLLIITFLASSYSFIHFNRHIIHNKYISSITSFTSLFDAMSERDMSVDEIKAELELRGADYTNCVSRGELVDLLIEIRMEGKADKEILDKFNEMDKDTSSNFDNQQAFSNQNVDQVVGKDGNLPGGLPPEMVKAMTEDPEILEMLRDPKTQDIMKAVMEGGPEAMKRYLSDPDAMLLLQKLGNAIERVKD